MASTGLTLRQERFARALPTAKSQKAAAIEAGYAPGANAEVRASELVRNRKVKPAIAQEREKLAERFRLEQDQVLIGLLNEARGLGPDTTSAARTAAYKLLGAHLGIQGFGSEVTLKIENPRLLQAIGRVTARYLTDPAVYRAWAEEVDAACR